ncbi:MAG: hypothetical protein LEGION0403_FIIPPAGN_02328 [Legionella sp.]|uniref:group II intron maturase-specific domain-containing protein n=1 Tax=Legionella sp. TaxID=459 RepID=UPI003D14C335
MQNIRDTIKSNATAKTENLIRILNPKIRGWANYHSHICSKQAFSKVSHLIFKALWQWAKRRHPSKGAGWIRQKYFRSEGNRHWVFFATTKDTQGMRAYLDLVEATATPIRRHIKIKAAANPYDPEYTSYFAERLKRSQRKSKANNSSKQTSMGSMVGN